MSKNGDTSPTFKILFFKKHLDLFKTDFFSTVQIKDFEIVFRVFDRLRTPVTVEADILSSLIVFYE